jgi:predicted alpha/beta superfamily hydrolase
MSWKQIFISLFITLFSFSCSKDEFKIETVESLEITSEHTKQSYLIKVLLPDNYSPSNQYPVVFLLDGYFWFNDTRHDAEELMSENQISDIILVSIEYKDLPFSISNSTQISNLRTTDLTYPTNDNEGGGGLEFYTFIKTELIPEIENKYACDENNRAIFGHSLGGYFVLFQMLNYENEPIFKSVVAISPSIWWADLNILKLEEAVFNSGKDLPFNLYTSVGNMEGVVMNSTFDEFQSRIESRNYSNLNYKFEKSKSGHTESARIGFRNALEHLY